MFISLSKTLARFGGFRLGVGMRMSKKNAPYLFIFAIMMLLFKMMWYMIVLTFWLMYAVIYGTFWILKKMFKISVPFVDKLFNKISEEYNKKEGYQGK
jgi:hypothetical protein